MWNLCAGFTGGTGGTGTTGGKGNNMQASQNEELLIVFFEFLPKAMMKVK
jgi:hypothetical protein